MYRTVWGSCLWKWLANFKVLCKYQGFLIIPHPAHLGTTGMGSYSLLAPTRKPCRSEAPVWTSAVLSLLCRKWRMGASVRHLGWGKGTAMWCDNLACSASQQQWLNTHCVLGPVFYTEKIALFAFQPVNKHWMSVYLFEASQNTEGMAERW